jgi:hypothetical protein
MKRQSRNQNTIQRQSKDMQMAIKSPSKNRATFKKKTRVEIQSENQKGNPRIKRRSEDNRKTCECQSNRNRRINKPYKKKPKRQPANQKTIREPAADQESKDDPKTIERHADGHQIAIEKCKDSRKTFKRQPENQKTIGESKDNPGINRTIQRQSEEMQMVIKSFQIIKGHPQDIRKNT